MKKRVVILFTIAITTLLAAFTARFVWRFLTDPWYEKLIISYMEEGGPGALPIYPEGYLITDYFRINSATVLRDLSAGKIEVFTPFSGEPHAMAPDILSSGAYPWVQADFLQVAGALHRQQWSESLDNWQLYELILAISNCHDDQKSFDFADFTFYKVEDKTYKVSTIEVYPLYQEIHWGGPKYDRLREWHQIDISKAELHAEDALRIAEEAGGKQARQNAQNQCYVDVILGSYGFESGIGWLVTYWSTAEGKYGGIFAIDIDANTGKFHIRE